MKHLLTLLAAFAIFATAAEPVFAQADASHYVLTDATLDRLKAAQAEIAQSGATLNDDLSGTDSVDEMARKIGANESVKAALAKQGLTPTDCALSVMAALHASLYLAAELRGDTTLAAGMMAGYTPEQRANIDLLKKRAAAAR